MRRNPDRFSFLDNTRRRQTINFCPSSAVIKQPKTSLSLIVGLHQYDVKNEILVSRQVRETSLRGERLSE